MSKKFSEKILAIQLAFLIAIGVIALFIFHACYNGANSGNGPGIIVPEIPSGPDKAALSAAFRLRKP